MNVNDSSPKNHPVETEFEHCLETLAWTSWRILCMMIKLDFLENAVNKKDYEVYFINQQFFTHIMNLIPFLTWCPKHPAAVLKCCSHLVYLQSRGVYVQMFFSILDWANQTWRMIWSLLCNCTIHHQILERWKYCKAGRTHSRQPWVQDMSASSLNLTTGFFKTALRTFYVRGTLRLKMLIPLSISCRLWH